MDITGVRVKSSFEQELAADLQRIHDAGLLRSLRRVDSPQGRVVSVEGRELLNFSSNDYLGLANHPALTEAAARVTKQFGVGAGASRLISGSLGPHHHLEEALAAFKGTEAALTFSSGYATAVGTISALMGKEDIIVLDKLVHASIVDAARLSGATLRVFKHNDVEDLSRILAWADQRRAGTTQERRTRVLVITESVFSMDGDVAPLADIVRAKEQCGAWLMVDEAHATGLFGHHGRGVADEQGVAAHVDVQMGTLGKALGSAGGYICGSRALVDVLINRARSFIFSTAPVTCQAAAALAGLGLLQSEEGAARRTAAWQRVAELKSHLPSGSLTETARRQPRPTGSLRETRGCIVPVIIGAERDALDAAGQLRANGFWVPAIRFPTVARGSARLRITVTAAHTAEDVQRLGEAMLSLQTASPAHS